MGYGLWDHGLPIFLLLAALTQRTERDSFNTRLLVSAGQENPRRSRRFLNFFLPFLAKVLAW